MGVVVAISCVAHVSLAQPASTPQCRKAISCCNGALKIDPDFFSGPTYCDNASIARYQAGAAESGCADGLVRIREQLGLLARALPDACAAAPQPPPEGWWSASEPSALVPSDVAVRFVAGELDYAGAREDRVAASLQPVAAGRWQLYGLSAGVFNLRRLARDRLSLTGPDGAIVLRAVPTPRARSFAERARRLPDPWQTCQALAACCDANKPDARASLSCRTAALAEVTTRPSTARCRQMLSTLVDWYRNQHRRPPDCAIAEGAR
jgi:hypothetical protein